MLNVEIDQQNVTIRSFPTLEDAERAAMREASATGGQLSPAVMFRQGERWMLTTAFLIPQVKNRLIGNHAERRGSVEQVRSATNRPVMEDHVKSVKAYLKANVGKRYILPPLTLNARQPLSIYKVDYESTMMAVNVVIPGNVKLEITDGGHRKRAIDEAFDELPSELADEFAGDAVAVMITIEDDLAQIHQDFADASKTKPLPKSQLAAYDRRHPANGIVLDLIDSCALFSGRVDSTSKTLSKNSNKLFLTNQVRQMVKELLGAGYGMADDQFEQRAISMLKSSNDPHYREVRDQFVEYVNAFTAAIPVLSGVAGLPDAPYTGDRVRELRQEGWLPLSATGLVLLGRIGYLLLKHDVPNRGDFVQKLGRVDWRKSGDLWQGNVIQQDGKIMTQQVPVRGAVNALRAAIGLTDEVLAEAGGEGEPVKQAA
jgi:DNA sulfur modification protein DndB